MLRKLLLLILVSCFPVVLRATEATPAKDAAAAPAAAATTPQCGDISIPAQLQQPPSTNLPGGLGRFPFTPDPRRPGTTYWKDSDGVDPGTAGCHIETDAHGQPDPHGRHFGEACGMHAGECVLVETNPKAGAVHQHPNDTGRPDVFSCAQWCIGAKHAKGGTCEPVTIDHGDCQTLASAFCHCT